MNAFETALEFTLHEEGGYVNNPHDHGGTTNQGITQRTYDAYRTSKGLPIQDVFNIQGYEIENIYEDRYWEPAYCAELPLKLSICHFDWAVNHGVTGAIKTLQTAAGVEPDGIFGPKTRSAIVASPNLVPAYLVLREEWYRDYVAKQPDQAVFLAGWLARIDRLRAYLAGIE